MNKILNDINNKIKIIKYYNEAVLGTRSLSYYTINWTLQHKCLLKTQSFSCISTELLFFFSVLTFIYFSIYLAALELSCEGQIFQLWHANSWLQHLIPQSGIKPGSPALGMPSLSHWTTREVSSTEFLNKEHCEGGGSNMDSLLLISRGFCKVRKKFRGRGIQVRDIPGGLEGAG